MTLEFVPFYKRVFSNADGSILVRLVASEFLVDPRMCVGREPQPTLWLPLFNCPYKTLNAVLASVNKMLLVLYDLADFPDEGEIMANHSIKALVGMDAM